MSGRPMKARKLGLYLLTTAPTAIAGLLGFGGVIGLETANRFSLPYLMTLGLGAAVATVIDPVFPPEVRPVGIILATGVGVAIGLMAPSVPVSAVPAICLGIAVGLAHLAIRWHLSRRPSPAVAP